MAANLQCLDPRSLTLLFNKKHWGPVEKCLILGLGWEIYKMSWEHPVVSESKEVILTRVLGLLNQ